MSISYCSGGQLSHNLVISNTSKGTVTVLSHTNKQTNVYCTELSQFGSSEVSEQLSQQLDRKQIAK